MQNDKKEVYFLTGESKYMLEFSCEIRYNNF